MMDAYDLWEREGRRRAELLRWRPRCTCCEEPIQEDHYYEFNGQRLCESCLQEYYRKELEDD